jgi:GTP pyrophosphokinase
MIVLLEKMPYLDDPGNKELFLRRIERIYPYPTDEYLFIERAYQTAKDAFREKYREDQLTRYFEHLRIVTLIGVDHLRIIDHEVIAALLLHDIVEDILGWTVRRVKLEFGMHVAKLVAYASKPSMKDFPDKEARDKVYHRRFMTAPREFFFLKLPDRLHNLWTLDACPRDKQERKIIETKRYYMPYAEREKILIHELEEAIERIEAMWVAETPVIYAPPVSVQGIAI